MFIRAEYPKRWASAFDDMLKLAGTDIRLTALFFRILDRVNEEVCGIQQVPSCCCSRSPSSFAYLLLSSLPGCRAPGTAPCRCPGDQLVDQGHHAGDGCGEEPVCLLLQRHPSLQGEEQGLDLLLPPDLCQVYPLDLCRPCRQRQVRDRTQQPTISTLYLNHTASTQIPSCAV